MTLTRATALLFCSSACLLASSCVVTRADSGAQEPPALPPPPLPPPPSSPAEALTPLEQLVAPIALYPDPLLALILPSAAAPRDLSAAAGYLIQYGDPTQIDSQPWDPAVRALAHYPAVVNWMVQNMPWTEALGEAFASSQAEVMEAIQQMREKALASGALTSTPQQRIYQDHGYIEIYPAQDDSVFVPVYQDDVVYSDSPYYGYGGPFINFGDPCPEGAWLSYYFDWGQHRIWSGDRTVWREHGGWLPPQPSGDHSRSGGRAWRPPPSAPKGPAPRDTTGTSKRPKPMAGAPEPPPPHYRQPPGSAEPQAPRRGQTTQPSPSTAAPLHTRTVPGLEAPAHPASPAPVEPGTRSLPPQSGPREASTHSAPAPQASTRPSSQPPRAYAPAPSRGAPPPPAPAPHASAAAPAPAPAQPAQSSPNSDREPQK